MWGFVSIAIAFTVLAVLALSDLNSSIGGFSPTELARLLGFLALISSLAGFVYNRFKNAQPWLLPALMSLLIACIPIVLYSRSNDIIAYLDQQIAGINPGRIVQSETGEVIVSKGNRSGFTLKGKIGDYEARFLFDTGATQVVITHETAVAMGINVDRLDYSEMVDTANGKTFAAKYTIPTLSIGPISEKNVSALIAQRDDLNGNLLGMSFLNRLYSYEVRGDKLILRGAP